MLHRYDAPFHTGNFPLIELLPPFAVRAPGVDIFPEKHPLSSSAADVYSQVVFARLNPSSRRIFPFSADARIRVIGSS